VSSKQEHHNIIKVIETADGSYTLYNTALDETYHSRKGALRESRHVFIKEGMDFMPADKELRILEVGFGTGLNAILALENAVLTGRKVYYQTLEPYPLSTALVKEVNYSKLIDASLSDLYFRLHELDWGKVEEFVPEFTFLKLEQKLADFTAESGSVNLVFYDAFAPQKQPDMWEAELFGKLFTICEPGAVLVSYCASGQFKRNLLAAGFAVEKIQGPPGKKEMIRAIRYV
jgi:tRNA U34 5-methylaminomethyl-2-thiouridine-forming methyltransferase MnmC